MSSPYDFVQPMISVPINVGAQTRGTTGDWVKSDGFGCSRLHNARCHGHLQVGLICLHYDILIYIAPFPRGLECPKPGFSLSRIKTISSQRERVGSPRRPTIQLSTRPILAQILRYAGGGARSRSGSARRRRGSARLRRR